MYTAHHDFEEHRPFPAIMPEDRKEQQAHQLQEAQQELESKIEDAASERQRNADTPLELNVGFEENPEVTGANKGDTELQRRVEELVEAFHQQAAVESSGVHVQKVTVIDADADGRVAVDVEYAYAE